MTLKQMWTETVEEIEFTKMHGAGNDYIYIDALNGVPENLQSLAIEISDRHFGVGSDGLVVIMHSDIADFRMRMFNADGSEAQMCGNASRCIAKFVYERHLTDKTIISLETLAGIKILRLNIEGDSVSDVTVDMGTPELRPSKIPVISRNSEMMVSEEIVVGEDTYRMTAVSMGNPHAVFFVDEITDKLVLEYGPLLECSDLFPEKANIEFVKVIDENHLEMRVWERGSGETLACGTGACAVAVASVLNGFSGRKVKISLPGGVLRILWDEIDNHVYLTGPAEFVCKGIYYRKHTKVK